MTLPGVAFWLILLLASFSRGPWFYGLLFASWSFGTLAVIPPNLTGASITPAWVCAVAFVVRETMRVGLARMFSTFFDPSRFLLLALCTLYGVVSCFLLPNLFQGQFDVVQMRPSLEALAGAPLAFTSSNITQTLYFIIANLFTLAVFSAASSKQECEQLFAGLRIGAVTVVLTGFLDLGLSATGGTALLTPFRNATYTLLLDDNVMGMKRTVGLMSEASSYAGLALSIGCVFAFLPTSRTSLTGGIWTQAAIVASLILMVYLSTSSGGYVGLGALGFLMTLNFIRGAAMGRPLAVAGTFGALAALTFGVGALLFAPSVAEYAQKLVDGLVLQKTTSQSFIERSSWNTVAIEAFFKSYLLGAGLGSVRASGWLVSVLGNIGLPGAVLLLMFIAQTVFGSAVDRRNRELLLGLKLALAIGMLAPMLSSTSVNYGLGNALLLGVALSLIRTPKEQSSEAVRDGAVRATSTAPAG